jgi:hypothetical protein
MTQSVAVTWLGIEVSTMPTFMKSRLTRRLVARGWEVCRFQDRNICKHTCSGRSSHTYITHCRVSYGQYRVP